MQHLQKSNLLACSFYSLSWFFSIYFVIQEANQSNTFPLKIKDMFNNKTLLTIETRVKHLQCREQQRVFVPYLTLHVTQITAGSGTCSATKRHFTHNTAEGFSSSHPIPVSHLPIGLYWPTFLTCVELSPLWGYQANNYMATSEPRQSKQPNANFANRHWFSSYTVKKLLPNTASPSFTQFL